MKTLTLILFAAFALPANAAPAKLAVERALEATAGTRADFVQKFTPRGFTRERVERGEVLFGPAPSMRWSYEDPERKTFVFDGRTSWLYTPAENQVTIATLTEADRKALPFVLLSEPGAIRSEYAVAEKREGNLVRTNLTPKGASAAVRDLIVVTSARDGRIQRIEYADAQGNRTAFEFSNYRADKVTDSTFRFIPPPGVDVVGN